MKKILTSIATFFIILTLIIQVGAIPERPIEIGPMEGDIVESNSIFQELNIQESEISCLTIEEMFELIENHHKSTFVPTQADLEKAENIIELYDSVFDNENISLLSDDYDENAAKLRTGNLIELTLDLDEGVSELTAVSAIADAALAKYTAKASFPSTWDSAQHFIWNYDMADDIGTLTARTIGNNHEWGIQMKEPILNYYDSAYEDRISAGENDADANSGALVDTIMYIPEFKYFTALLTQDSFELFQDFFDSGNIMDFWNNCYGRAYAAENYSSSSSAYEAAKNAGELIIDGADDMEENVTNEHFQCVWAWDWYTY